MMRLHRNQSSLQTLQRGFTLIELLIVLAIISILAAIAVTNFLEAQVRTKVTRAKSDMRSMATGIEAWAVDNNGYPDMFTRMRVITTPIAYLSAVPKDAFRSQEAVSSNSPWAQKYYRYGAMPIDTASRFILESIGPDLDIDTYSSLNTSGGADTENTANFEPDNMALRLYPGYTLELFSSVGVVVNSATFKYVMYDPTNGVVSNGDIFRASDHQMP